MIYQVKDLYKYAKENNIKLLSSLNKTWWEDYNTYYEKFDKLFMKTFTSWYPFDQDEDLTLAERQAEFTADVEAFLLSNDKRYSELFRVMSIPDDTAYSLTNNVDYTETLERTEDRDGSYTKGSETITDSGSNQYGSQTVETENELQKGQMNTTTTHSTSASNESEFTPVDSDSVNEGMRTDVESTDVTYGSHTDNLSNTRVDGAREDSTTDDAQIDQTIHKVGNMGVQTVDDMLKKHWENWVSFDFYRLVFKEIADNLLLGVI